MELNTTSIEPVKQETSSNKGKKKNKTEKMHSQQRSNMNMIEEGSIEQSTSCDATENASKENATSEYMSTDEASSGRVYLLKRYCGPEVNAPNLWSEYHKEVNESLSVAQVYLERLAETLKGKFIRKTDKYGTISLHLEVDTEVDQDKLDASLEQMRAIVHARYRLNKAKTAFSERLNQMEYKAVANAMNEHEIRQSKKDKDLKRKAQRNRSRKESYLSATITRNNDYKTITIRKSGIESATKTETKEATKAKKLEAKKVAKAKKLEANEAAKAKKPETNKAAKAEKLVAKEAAKVEKAETKEATKAKKKVAKAKKLEAKEVAKGKK
jgi:hypothetical protein